MHNIQIKTLVYTNRIVEHIREESNSDGKVHLDTTSGTGTLNGGKQ